ncbi:MULTISPECIES: hypothetical protein [unclassified Sphingomonas]|uniref:hypothetical protein n=1 Tax=unclassified Sphingomonas TaxID=196159 RepID=UPI0006F8EF0B|nr:MULTISPECIES: hypothetical protein [unclassified Sphingomonas]KQM24734.1 hypothetical protein ASE58_15135 [Sphingomonas sp. Leaf9]KQM42392.1 hypothetical protein ASE57_15140 [Sphingomonas sp. Leaf11]
MAATPARWMQVNAFLADVRDGLGPYLAIYLVSVRGPTHGWDEATVGIVMTIASIAGLLVTTPAGALVDRIKAKRAPLPVMVAAIMRGTGRFSAALGLALLWFKMPETAER